MYGRQTALKGHAEALLDAVCDLQEPRGVVYNWRLNQTFKKFSDSLDDYLSACSRYEAENDVGYERKSNE